MHSYNSHMIVIVRPGNTAIHYAIREGRLETVSLLLKVKADPHLRNDFSDDALTTACLRGHDDIMELLIKTMTYSRETVANAYELIGASYADEKHDLGGALNFWRRGMALRFEQPDAVLPKSDLVPPRDVYQQQTEACSMQELESIASSPDAIHLQSLLVRERILGAQHKDTVFGLMYRGAVYADTNQYQRCVDLWKYAFVLRHDKEEAISSECIFTLQALCKLFWEIHEEWQSNFVTANVKLHDVMEVLKCSVLEVIRKKDVPPAVVCLNQQHNVTEPGLELQTMLVLILHMASLVLKLSPEPSLEFKRLMHSLLRSGASGGNGQSLLHLACDKKMSSLADDFYSQLPDLDLVRMLLDCGANAEAVDSDNNTVLHVCAEGLNQLHTQRKYRETVEELVGILLASGAHIDVINRRGINACDVLKFRCPNVHVVHHVTLKCLAARTIAKQNINYQNADIPSALIPFVDMHKGFAPRC